MQHRRVCAAPATLAACLDAVPQHAQMAYGCRAEPWCRLCQNWLLMSSGWCSMRSHCLRKVHLLQCCLCRSGLPSWSTATGPGLVGRYASAPNLPGLASDSSSLERQQLANVPAGETQFCMFASRICPPLSDDPKQQIVSVAIPSGPKRALHPMSACTVLQSCLALVAASGLLHVQGCPGSWQTHAQFAVSSCSKPRGLLSLLQRSDCQLPGPALR